MLLGYGLGWRATSLGVAGLAALSFVGILTWLPPQPPSVTPRLGEVAAGISLAALLTVLGTGQADKPPIPAPRA